MRLDVTDWIFVEVIMFFMFSACVFKGKYLQGEDVTKLASMCKLKSGRLAREISDACLQYYGGMGFSSDMLVSRMYR